MRPFIVCVVHMKRGSINIAQTFSLEKMSTEQCDVNDCMFFRYLIILNRYRSSLRLSEIFGTVTKKAIWQEWTLGVNEREFLKGYTETKLAPSWREHYGPSTNVAQFLFPTMILTDDISRGSVCWFFILVREAFLQEVIWFSFSHRKP